MSSFPQVIEYLVLAMLYIASGGALLTEWGRHHTALTTLAIGVALMMTAYSWRDRIKEWFGEPADKNTNTVAVIPMSARPAASDQDFNDNLQPQVILGTLPPDGVSALSYVIRNNNTSTSVNNVSASAWAYARNSSLQKVADQKIGYIEKGGVREIRNIDSPISFGKIIICLSYSYGSQKASELYFFESVGEYAKYGPMLAMRQFRDPIIDRSEKSNCLYTRQSLMAYSGK